MPDFDLCIPNIQSFLSLTFCQGQARLGWVDGVVVLLANSRAPHSYNHQSQKSSCDGYYRILGYVRCKKPLTNWAKVQTALFEKSNRFCLIFLPDPYCKVYLMCQGKKLRKRKTTVKKSCLCPVWNESVVFDVPSEMVQDIQLIFKLSDYDRVGPNEQLGVAAAGALCIGPGRDHWLEMLDNPRRPVAQW